MGLNLLVINLPDDALAERLVTAAQAVRQAQQLGPGTAIPYGWLELYRAERLCRAVVRLKGRGLQQPPTLL